MRKSISLIASSLHECLLAFDPQDTFYVEEMGDTWHPMSGFVDESVFEGINTVEQVLSMEYQFKGIVYFKGRIGALTVQYSRDKTGLQVYEVSGNEKEVWRLIHQLEARQLLSPVLKT